MGQQVLHAALELSSDLQESESSGAEGHKDPVSPVPKLKRRYRKNKYDSSSVRRSIRLKSKSK